MKKQPALKNEVEDKQEEMQSFPCLKISLIWTKKKIQEMGEKLTRTNRNSNIKQAHR